MLLSAVLVSGFSIFAKVFSLNRNREKVLCVSLVVDDTILAGEGLSCRVQRPLQHDCVQLLSEPVETKVDAGEGKCVEGRYLSRDLPDGRNVRSGKEGLNQP